MLIRTIKMIKMNTETLSMIARTQTIRKAIERKWQLVMRTLLWSVVLTIAATTTGSAQTPQLADNFPDRYTVVEGDTLWGISSRFLSDPWRWPEVWQGNPQVENPDLIFPGDVLVLTFVDGRPVLRSLRRQTVKLSPSPRVTKLSDASNTVATAKLVDKLYVLDLARQTESAMVASLQTWHERLAHVHSQGIFEKGKSEVGS